MYYYSVVAIQKLLPLKLMHINSEQSYVYITQPWQYDIVIEPD